MPHFGSSARPAAASVFGLPFGLFSAAGSGATGTRPVEQTAQGPVQHYYDLGSFVFKLHPKLE